MCVSIDFIKKMEKKWKKNSEAEFGGSRKILFVCGKDCLDNSLKSYISY